MNLEYNIGSVPLRVIKEYFNIAAHCVTASLMNPTVVYNPEEIMVALGKINRTWHSSEITAIKVNVSSTHFISN